MLTADKWILSPSKAEKNLKISEAFFISDGLINEFMMVTVMRWQVLKFILSHLQLHKC